MTGTKIYLLLLVRIYEPLLKMTHRQDTLTHYVSLGEFKEKKKKKKRKEKKEKTRKDKTRKDKKRQEKKKKRQEKKVLRNLTVPPNALNNRREKQLVPKGLPREIGSPTQE